MILYSVFIVISAVAAAYILGSIPSGYLAGRIKGIDIREHGSGNVGATNVMRTLGKVPGAAVLIVDAAKGLLAVTILYHFFFAPLTIALPSILRHPTLFANIFQIALGAAAIAGHMWSIFTNFKGGKGVATAACVALGIDPTIALCALGAFLIALLISRHVSLGSITAVAAASILTVVLGRTLPTIVFILTVCTIVILRHKENIKRILKGTERKIWRK